MILKTGVELAPQVSSLRYAAAQAMMSRGQYAQAVIYLLPLANNPHGGDSLTEVRELLQEAMQKAGMTPAATAEAAPSAP